MKKAIQITEGIYAIFCENNNYMDSVKLSDLISMRAELQSQNTELDISDDDDALLAWAKENFMYYGDGKIVANNNKEIARLTTIIDLIESI